MLEKKIFDQFIQEVNKVYQSFCVWVYVNNNYVKYKSYFNDVPQGEDCKFANFWVVSMVALQHSFILGMSRLLDDPYCIGDTEKKEPRLSVLFILEQLNDENISKTYASKTADKNFKKFMYSNRDLRDGKLAHNSVDPNAKTQKAGIEDFFDILEWLINEIKTKHKTFNSCNDPCYKRADELSKKGVEQIFENIIKNKNVS